MARPNNTWLQRLDAAQPAAAVGVPRPDVMTERVRSSTRRHLPSRSIRRARDRAQWTSFRNNVLPHVRSIKVGRARIIQ